MRTGTLARRFGWLLVALTASACQSTSGLVFSASELRSEVRHRAGDLAPIEIVVPYEVDGDPIERSRNAIEALPPGEARVYALVDLLSVPRPEGFGLRYRGSVTASARETLEHGEGNCVSLASVLVALARGVGWKAYYAEAGVLRDEEVEGSEIEVRADHMVVVVEAAGVVRVVDFRAEEPLGGVRVIDDVTAYGHFVNNLGFERILGANRQKRAVPWRRVRDDFALAIAISPGSARAWNNLGVALARMGQDEEARNAYVRAQELDEDLSSAQRNLDILETRSTSGSGAGSSQLGSR